MAEHVSDDIQQGAQKAAQTGVKAAKAGKTVAKAAGMVATGNYVGAAAETLKNDTTRNVIIFFTLFAFFSVFCAVFLVPTLLFESLAALVQEFSDHYAEHYASREGNFGAMKATMQAVLETASGRVSQSLLGRLLSKVANWFSAKAKALFTGVVVKRAGYAIPPSAQEVGDTIRVESDKTIRDYLYDDDRDILQTPLQTAKTYKRKIEIAERVFLGREKELAQDIMQDSDFAQSNEDRSGDMQFNQTGRGKAKKGSWIDNKFRKEVFPSQFPQGIHRWEGGDSKTTNELGETIPVYGYRLFTFNKVDVLIRKKTVKPQECVRLMALYELLSVDTAGDITAAGFSRWVGVFDGIVYEEPNEYSVTPETYVDTSKTVYIDYDVGDSGYTRTGFPARKGGFMPKYLVIEETDAKYNWEEGSMDNIIAFAKQIIKNKTDRKKYDLSKVAPVDLMLKIKSPSPYECPPIVEPDGDSGLINPKYETRWITRRAAHSRGFTSLSIDNDVNQYVLRLLDTNAGGKNAEPFLQLLGYSSTVIVIPGGYGGGGTGGYGYQTPTPWSNGPGGSTLDDWKYEEEMRRRREQEEEERYWNELVPITVTISWDQIFYFKVRYEYPVTISVRDSEQLVELAAFYQGMLDTSASSVSSGSR